ncbi:MAG: GH109 [uncultured Phycisphaerae bacterium]|uniref:GH109 n=1 Tax=uncultured Phycisphaerae bacterium TaxID=904963 RepID=A0A6J4PVQ3_9BACT|nr:MAG: GH109 [uncultured Phycisphaerae bacterium]
MRSTRRQLLGSAAAVAGAGFWVGARRGWAAAGVSPNERLGVGVIGVAHRGAANLSDLLGVPTAEVVALCDVDDRNLAAAGERCPDAAHYNDFRQMLEKERRLDAVLIATADHTHGPASVMALDLGKHVYCEKPLTHNVFEARRVTEAAARNKRVTQLGTQIHALDNYRRVVELVRSGAVGPVREVHVFVDKVWAAKGDGARPAGEHPPVPKGLHYDLWLGPAEAWPYHPEWLPANWRRWWNFGNGTLGDMGCHYMDLPFWALELKYPTRVSADGPPPSEHGCPPWLTVQYDFPARGDAPPVKLNWYDAGKKPAAYKDWNLPTGDWENGVVFVGDKGLLAADYNRRVLLPEKAFAGFEPPAPSIPKSIGHHAEWVEACRKGDPSAAACNFDYSGPLSEAVLLGTVAYRTGKPLEWDAANLKVTNAPEADRYVRRAYRKGWEVV